jgi:hypothetical protein
MKCYYILVGQAEKGVPFEMVFGDYVRKNVREEFVQSSHKNKKIYKLLEDSNDYLLGFMEALNNPRSL